VAIRDLLDNATRLHCIGDLTSRPLADRAAGAFWRCTGQFEDLADLLGGDTDGFAQARGISEAFNEREVLKAGRGTDKPAGAPEPNGVEVDAKFTSDRGISCLTGTREHNAGTQCQLLGGGVATNKLLTFAPHQRVAFQPGRFGTTHSSPRVQQVPSRRLARGPVYLGLTSAILY
jgi:hypothetical protein